jgi:hypothetical protein
MSTTQLTSPAQPATNDPLAASPALADKFPRKPYIDPNPNVQKEIVSLLTEYVKLTDVERAEEDKIKKENGIFGAKLPDHIAFPWIGSGREPMASFLLLEIARLRLRVKELEG